MTITGRKMAELVKIDSAESFARAVEKAAEIILSGGLVAVPTETVYGLAACATNPVAVSRIFSVKGRPSNNPIIIHVCSVEMAKEYVAEWPSTAQLLSSFFWPGPLTLVLKKNSRVPDIVTAGGLTVAVRMPNQAFTLALISKCGIPLAAPSANLSGYLSPTTAGHVIEQLGDKIDLVVDAGPTQVGIESTVLDLTVDPPQILRPGILHAAILEGVIGKIARGPTGNIDIPLRSPGLLPRHYSPRTPLHVVEFCPADSNNILYRYSEEARKFGFTLSECYVIAHKNLPPRNAVKGLSVMPADPVSYAHLLYSELYKADASCARLILVEAPPREVAWEGIIDRLIRAQHTISKAHIAGNIGPKIHSAEN